MQNWSTDKLGLGYLPTYEAIAGEFAARGLAPVILEVGVASGAGLIMFRELFEGSTVIGVDIMPDAGGLERGNHRIITSAQEDPGLPLVLESTVCPGYDLIVDDASHLAGPTAVTLANLWRLVNEGGYYVIEDWNHLEGPGNAQNLWQKVAGYFLALPNRLARQPAPYSGILERVESFTVRNGLIVIKKGDPGKYPGE